MKWQIFSATNGVILDENRKVKITHKFAHCTSRSLKKSSLRHIRRTDKRPNFANIIFDKSWWNTYLFEWRLISTLAQHCQTKYSYDKNTNFIHTSIFNHMKKSFLLKEWETVQKLRSASENCSWRELASKNGCFRYNNTRFTVVTEINYVRADLVMVAKLRSYKNYYMFALFSSDITNKTLAHVIYRSCVVTERCIIDRSFHSYHIKHFR